MQFKPLDTGPGEVKWSMAEDESGMIYLQAEQDITAYLDHNKRAQNEIGKGWLDVSKTQAHKAHIPTIVIEMWKNMYGVDVFNPDHQDKVLKLLDDPDWAALRTGSGRLSYRR